MLGALKMLLLVPLILQVICLQVQQLEDADDMIAYACAAEIDEYARCAELNEKETSNKMERDMDHPVYKALKCNGLRQRSVSCIENAKGQLLISNQIRQTDSEKEQRIKSQEAIREQQVYVQSKGRGEGRETRTGQKTGKTESFFYADSLEMDGRADSDSRSVLFCVPLRSDDVVELASGREAFVHCMDLLDTSSEHALSLLFGMPEAWKTHVISVPMGAIDRSFEMYVSDDYISTRLITYGVFAPVFTQLVHDITYNACRDSPQVVLDLGCNLGLFSLAALFNGCHVVCVEPNDKLVPLIVRSILRNNFKSSAVVVQAAAGSGWKEINLTTDRFTDRDPSIGEVREAPRGQGSAFSLPIGDYLVAPLLLLKVDVEWHEVEAALGLGMWMKSNGWRHLTIEIKSDIPRAMSIFLQGCKGLPRFRAYVEQYDQKLEVWGMNTEHFSEYSLEEVMGYVAPGHGRKPVAAFEDWWVECLPQ
jgi:FkbM family methyltransferase